jgi:hypothetical protein
MRLWGIKEATIYEGKCGVIKSSYLVCPEPQILVFAESIQIYCERFWSMLLTVSHST